MKATSGRRRLDIQGLRAVAVLMVVAFHAGLPVPGGFVGVDVFFVISGFVITSMLKREWEETGRIRFRTFYFRRFKRLIPALALMVVVTIVASALLLSVNGTQQKAAWTAIGAALFAANLVIANVTGGYFDAPAHENPLLNTWSLSVEEQFYFVFPLILYLSWRLTKGSHARRALPVLLVGVIGAISFYLALLGSAESILVGGTWLLGFYSPLTRAWEFSVGAILALVHRAGHGRSFRTSATWLAIAGLVLLCASLWTISEDTPFPGAWTLLPVIGTALLTLAGNRGPNFVSRILCSKALVAIGDWSYSIYLWHWPLIVFAGAIWANSWWAMLLAAALAFPVAIASYYLVEQPIRTAAVSSPRAKIKLVAVTVTAPLAVGIAVGLGARTWYGREDLRIAAATMEELTTGWATPYCSTRAPFAKRNVSLCQWNTRGQGPPVYLVGDSNAMHFSDALIAAGATLQRKVTALTSPGCPLIDAHFRRKGYPTLQEECREFYVSMVHWLRHQPPGTILISSVDRYWRDRDYLVADLAEGFDAAVPDLNAAVLNAGLKRAVIELQSAGHSVTLVQTIPHFIGPYQLEQIRCSALHLLVTSCQIPFAMMSLKSADEWQSKSRYGIEQVAHETGANVLDLRPFFCPGGACSTRHASGTDLYMSDGYHLNKRGSLLLTGAFVAHLSTAK